MDNVELQYEGHHKYSLLDHGTKVGEFDDFNKAFEAYEQLCPAQDEV